MNNTPFLYRGPRTPEALPAMARVLTVDLEEETVAYPYAALAEHSGINDTVAGQPVALFWQAGTASALDTASLASGRDVGTGAAFSRELDGRVLEFELREGVIRDRQTASSWNLLGAATAGPLQGSRLRPVVSVNHFWFSWAAFRPETPHLHGSLTPAPGRAIVGLAQGTARWSVTVRRGPRFPVAAQFLVASIVATVFRST